MAKRENKSFTIIEIAAIVSMVTLTGFLGFSYVNGQQKLASTSTRSSSDLKDVNQQNNISPSDIQPINNSADLNKAYSQLDSMERELSNVQDIAALSHDLDSITN